jgi:hypothetical protein
MPVKAPTATDAPRDPDAHPGRPPGLAIAYGPRWSGRQFPAAPIARAVRRRDIAGVAGKHGVDEYTR